METLKIKECHFLSSDDAIIRSIITGERVIEKLIIKGTINAFEPSFIGTAEFVMFCQRIGKSVTSLVLNERPPRQWSFLNFPHLKSLSVETLEILCFMLPLLQENNVTLEELIVHEKVIESTINDLEVMNDRFINHLRQFEVLKSLTFKCWIPLEQKTIMTLFSTLNSNIWHFDEVIIDADLLPKWSDYLNFYWFIEMVKIEFLRKQNTTKMVVKPLFIREKIQVKNGSKIACRSNCAIKHLVVQCGTVERFTYENHLKCLNYHQSTFDSFPLVKKINQLYIDDFIVLKLMSKTLHDLIELSITYDANVQDVWPSFPQVTKLQLYKEGSISNESFEKLIRSFRNLTKLSISYEDHISADDAVKIITENLKNLETLSIKCKESTLTVTGLDLIGYKLKKLKKLTIDYFENFSDIQNLFYALPKLETLVYGKSFMLRPLLDRLIEDVQIRDLPPEITEQIFLHLNKNEQQTFRQVCKYWFEIHASSPKIIRTLNLRNSYLSWAVKPVSIFINTQSKYNLLVFGDTTFANDEDLTGFWKKIGPEVFEIVIKGNKFDIHRAVKSGFKANYFEKFKNLTIEILPLFYSFIQNINFEWKSLLDRVEHLSVNYLLHRIDTPNVSFTMPNVTKLTIDGCMNETTETFLNRISFPKTTTLIIIHVSYEKIDLEDIFETNFNFNQVKTLFLANYYDWIMRDFELIARNCPNLEHLGIGFITRRDDYSEDFDFEAVAKKMFDSLSTLNGLYFVIFENTDEKEYVTYVRTGVNFTKSEKSFYVFDEINSTLQN